MVVSQITETFEQASVRIHSQIKERVGAILVRIAVGGVQRKRGGGDLSLMDAEPIPLRLRRPRELDACEVAWRQPKDSLRPATRHRLEQPATRQRVCGP